MLKTQKILFALSVLVYVIILFLFVPLKIKPISIYTIAFIASSVLYIFICLQILKYELPLKYVYILLALGIIIKVSFMPVHPIGSDDYYRYVWDGKVQANGINPYKYAPADSALNNLHSDILPKLVNYPEMKSIYPPLSQIIFYLSYLISGESFIGLKIFLLISELLSIFGIYLILKKLKLPLRNILIYALCALPVFQLFIDAHLDGFGLPLMLFSIYFYLSNRKNLSYTLLGASICIKPFALFLIPVLFFIEKGWKDKIRTVFIPALVCILFYLPYVFSGSPFQALRQFTENWTFNGIVFDILDSFIKDNQRSRLICAILFVISYLPVILSKKELFTKIYMSIILLFIFSPIVHPWYLSWLAVILPFYPRWSGIVYVGLISLTSFTILNYHLNGVWTEYTPALILEYVPVVSLFIYELIKPTQSELNYEC